MGAFDMAVIESYFKRRRAQTQSVGRPAVLQTVALAVLEGTGRISNG